MGKRRYHSIKWSQFLHFILWFGSSINCNSVLRCPSQLWSVRMRSRLAIGALFFALIKSNRARLNLRGIFRYDRNCAEENVILCD